MQAIDPPAARESADEFYAFAGDARYGKPAYWVARHGLIVTSQTTGQPIETIGCATLDHARAEFAQETCDPAGPGAPQAGDVIRIVWGAHADHTLTVTGAQSYHSPRYAGEFDHARVTGTLGNGVVVELEELLFGQYEIVSRPAEG